jgi:Uma2 family endonuclease
MTLLVADPQIRDRLIAERRATGGDRYDEVWDGVYLMSPPAGDEHQEVVAALGGILYFVVGLTGLGIVRTGVNVSDREENWTENYRVPDVAVHLADGRARVLPTHWLGGPDFLVEVLSPGDRARDKLTFYASIGVREALLIDRDPWSLELYGLCDGRLLPLGVSRPESPATLASSVVPLAFRLDPGDGSGRPRVVVEHDGSGQRWVI